MLRTNWAHSEPVQGIQDQEGVMRTSRWRSRPAERPQDQQKTLRKNRKSSGPAEVAQQQQRVLRTGKGHSGTAGAHEDHKRSLRTSRGCSELVEGIQDQQGAMRTSRGWWFCEHTQCPVGCWMTYRVASTAPVLLEYIYYQCRCFSSVLFSLLTAGGVQMLCDVGRFLLILSPNSSTDLYPRF
jgi:hypothetical protein